MIFWDIMTGKIQGSQSNSIISKDVIKIILFYHRGYLEFGLIVLPTLF
jgi:hypothetical protein